MVQQVIRSPHEACLGPNCSHRAIRYGRADAARRREYAEYALHVVAAYDNVRGV